MAESIEQAVHGVIPVEEWRSRVRDLPAPEVNPEPEQRLREVEGGYVSEDCYPNAGQSLRSDLERDLDRVCANRAELIDMLHAVIEERNELRTAANASTNDQRIAEENHKAVCAEVERLKDSLKSTHEHVDKLADELTRVRTNLSITVKAARRLATHAKEVSAARFAIAHWKRVFARVRS